MNSRHDLLIIGAGPAGIAAALAAAPSGASILLVDDNPTLGGQIWRDGPAANLPRPVLRLREQLLGQSNVHLSQSTRVIAPAGPGRLLLEDETRGWIAEYGRLILCNGARELLLPFPGWTLPGVTGAGGLQALIKGGLPVAGERIVVAGSGPLLLASAASARQGGARLLRIAEQASPGELARFAAGLWRWPGKAMQALTLADRRYRAGWRIVEAYGDGRVQGVRLQNGAQQEDLPCDRLAVGFGLVPNVELGQVLGCRLEYSALWVDPNQMSSVQGIYAAGDCTGFGGSEKARVEGAIAGYMAVEEAAAARALWPRRQRWQAFAVALARHFALAPDVRQLPRADTLVCRCEDVSHGQLLNLPGWRKAKLHTRCGMGACQGRVCGSAARVLYGWQPPAPRPPLAPARIATLLALDEDD